ncbi:phospholipase D-like domain-containing protein [Pararhodobacter oceanensis]|uniref:phospholipase D-like domain-containing protein n=1 Tax=Pararhodobacter oceanensis TaxID=2172121 RepID=UPI003A94198E
MAALLGLTACAGGIRPISGSPPDTVTRAAFTPPANAEPVQAYPQVGGRHAMNYLVVSRAGPAEGQDLYYFTGREAGEISISFLNRARSRMTLRATCDARGYARPSTHLTTRPAWVAPGQAISVVLGPRERHRTWLALDPAVTRCDLTVTPGGGTPYVIRLRREELARPELARVDARHPGCQMPATGDPLARAFLGGAGLSITCPLPLGATRILPGGAESLNAKVEALTGRRLPADLLEHGTPDIPLDFSRAPQLDLIYLNYLNLNADFAGALMARMLAYHAARGTIVRILVADVFLTEADRRLFEGLAARYPTVQLQPFRMPASAAQGFEGQLGRLHRTTHVKFFATLARDAGRSRVMIGGRNLHEGYFYELPRDLSAFPELHQYDPEEARVTGGFTSYDDFEIELRSDRATQGAIQHMAALWHRDFDSQRPRPAGPVQQASAQVEGRFRHFISVPFADGAAQLPYYTAMIDAAQHSIEIAIPYLNLPPEIFAALQRAQARGVRVEVVTTVRVRELADYMVSNFNRMFANDFADWVHFIDYDPFPRLLHSKLIVIDGRLTVVASTNLNLRSFHHDMENGLVIMDRGVAREITAVIRSYVAQGARYPAGQEVPRLFQRLARIGWIARAF